MNEPTYTLEELADAFELTPRTARHYIEKILPAHHKKGRGKLARYGQDTWNCFAFIQKARKEKLTTSQISRVLADLEQEQIDRVAEGEEDLTILPIPSASPVVYKRSAPQMVSASRRFSNYRAEARPPDDVSSSLSGALDFEYGETDALFEADSSAEPRSAPRWQVLYSDDELQITHQGEASAEQREQVRLAATLIKRILKTEWL